MNETVRPLAAEHEPVPAPPAEHENTADVTDAVDPVGADRHGGGDGEVTFADFVAHRSQALLRAAYLLTGDAQLAEDLLQTALAKTWRHWRRVDRDGSGEAYVRKVLYTTYASWWRRRWRGETPTEVPPEPDGAGRGPDAYAGIDERTCLLRALTGLPRGQRAVLVLRYFEDHTEAETARILGCSTGTVKSQTARALTRLRSSPIINALVQEETT